MSKLKVLLTLAVLGASSVAIAEPTIRGGITIQLGDPQPVVTRSPPPRGFVRFDEYDARYDRDDRRRATRDISGVYDSQYGRVTLTQKGNRVTGTYHNAAGPGFIKGRIRGGMVHFRWRQAGNEGKGVFRVTGARRNPVLAGTWGAYESRTNGGRWRLEPVRVGFRDRNDRRNDRYRRY